MPTCYDPLTNKTVTVNGPCPGGTVPWTGVVPNAVRPQGTETPVQATPGGSAQQATGQAVGQAAQNIPGVQGAEQAAQAAQQAAQAAQQSANAVQQTVNNVNNFLTGGKNLKEMLALWSDPTTWKRFGLLVAGGMLLLLGFVLWAFGGRNRQPTEVVQGGS